MIPNSIREGGWVYGFLSASQKSLEVKRAAIPLIFVVVSLTCVGLANIKNNLVPVPMAKARQRKRTQTQGS